MADRCACGREISHPKGGGRRAKCEACSPPRGKRAKVVQLGSEPAESPLVGAVRAELDAVGRSDSAHGALALHAARLLAEGEHTGASAAALIKELAARVDAATKGASSGADIVDELKAKRAQRRGA